jgi:hypothetical protein
MPVIPGIMMAVSKMLMVGSPEDPQDLLAGGGVYHRHTLRSRVCAITSRTSGSSSTTSTTGPLGIGYTRHCFEVTC